MAKLKDVIDGLSIDSTPDDAADYLMTYDDSASDIKKVLLNNLAVLNDWSGVITLDQGGAVAKTVTYAKWVRFGKLVILLVALTATAGGTGGQNISIGGIPVVIANVASFWGMGIGIFEKAGGNRYTIAVTPASSSTLLFFSGNVGQALGANPAVTLANGDLLSFVMVYETS